MIWLISELIAKAHPLLRQSIVGGGLVAVDLTLDWFRQQALKIAPGSEQAAIEEAARTAMRLLNLSGEEVLWPVHGRRHAQAGEPITPRYMVVDLTRGRAWFMETYTSRKSVNRARSFGQRRGFSRGSNFQLRQSTAYAKGA